MKDDKLPMENPEQTTPRLSRREFAGTASSAIAGLAMGTWLVHSADGQTVERDDGGPIRQVDSSEFGSLEYLTTSPLGPPAEHFAEVHELHSGFFPWWTQPDAEDLPVYQGWPNKDASGFPLPASTTSDPDAPAGADPADDMYQIQRAVHWASQQPDGGRVLLGPYRYKYSGPVQLFSKVYVSGSTDNGLDSGTPTTEMEYIGAGDGSSLIFRSSAFVGSFQHPGRNHYGERGGTALRRTFCRQAKAGQRFVEILPDDEHPASTHPTHQGRQCYTATHFAQENKQSPIVPGRVVLVSEGRFLRTGSTKSRPLYNVARCVFRQQMFEVDRVEVVGGVTRVYLKDEVIVADHQPGLEWIPSPRLVEQPTDPWEFATQDQAATVNPDLGPGPHTVLWWDTEGLYDWDYDAATGKWTGGDPRRGNRPWLWTTKVVVKNIHLFNGVMPVAPGGLNHRALYENIEVKSYHPGARRNQILSSTFQRSTLRNIRGTVKHAWMFELKGGACRTVLDGCKFTHTGGGGDRAMMSLSEGDYNLHFVNCEFVWTNEDGNGVGGQINMMFGCHGGRIQKCLFRHEYVMPISEGPSRFIAISAAKDTEVPNYGSPEIPITKKYDFDPNWPDAHDWTQENGFWSIQDNRYENIHAQVAYAFGAGTTERCQIINDQWDDRCRVSADVLRTTGKGLLQYSDSLGPAVETW